MTMERRKHRRCLIRGVAGIRIPGGTTPIQGVLEDMSVGGLSIYTMERLPMKTEMQLDVEVSTPQAEVVRDRFQGKVAWSRPWGGFILHGIEFTDGLKEEHHPDV